MKMITVKTIAALCIATLAVCVASLVLDLTVLTALTAMAAEPTEPPVVVEIVQPTPAEPTEPAPVREPDPYRADIPLSRELQEVLREACAENGIPFAIGVGLIDVESDFDSDAVSGSGCYGLCQLNPKYFPSGLNDEENIRTGIGYLGEQLERYDGDMEAALQSYHDGHDTGKRWYAAQVLSDAEYWKA